MRQTIILSALARSPSAAFLFEFDLRDGVEVPPQMRANCTAAGRNPAILVCPDDSETLRTDEHGIRLKAYYAGAAAAARPYAIVIPWASIIRVSCEQHNFVAFFGEQPTPATERD